MSTGKVNLAESGFTTLECFNGHYEIVTKFQDREAAWDAYNQLVNSDRVIDLDKVDFEAIKQAASESKWIPPEYMRNEWISDVCSWLRDGPPVSEQSGPVKWGSPKTVRQLIQQLLTLDQDLEPKSMLRIPDYKDGKQVKATHLSMSYERVDGPGDFLVADYKKSEVEGTGRKVLAFWCKPDPRPFAVINKSYEAYQLLSQAEANSPEGRALWNKVLDEANASVGEYETCEGTGGIKKSGGADSCPRCKGSGSRSE